jgi:hypothetical protein
MCLIGACVHTEIRQNGTFDSVCPGKPDDLGHQVLIVGYTPEAWHIKNSCT